MRTTNSRKPRDYRILRACRKVIPHDLRLISEQSENSAEAFGKLGSEGIIKAFWYLF